MNPIAPTSRTTTKRRKSTAKTAGALAVAGLLVGTGAFAAFSDTETATRNVDAGQLDITVSPADLSISDIAPGDIWSEPMTIELPDANNDGDLIDHILMSNTAVADVAGQHMDNGVAGPDGSESLYSGASGLRLVVQNCAGGTWLPAAPGFFTCDGGTVVDMVGDAGNAEIAAVGDVVSGETLPDSEAVAYNFDAAAFGVAPTADGTIPDGSELNLLVTAALPGDNLFGAAAPADNAYENASVTISFDLEAVQRAGVQK